MRPCVLLLDAVGTVIRFRESPAHAYARVGRAHSIETDAASVQARLEARPVRPPALEGIAHKKIPGLEREFWREVVRQGLGDVAADGPCFDELHDLFARPAAWRPVPGALDALRRAIAGGTRVGVVSNMDSRLLPLLEALGLSACLDCIVIPSNSGLRKPDKRVFELALERLGAADDAGTVLYIDDETEHVAVARRAGLRGLCYDPSSSAENPGTLESWAALDAHLG